MKKLIIALLVLCVVCVVLASFLGNTSEAKRPEPTQAPAPAPATTEPAEEETAQEQSGGVDFEAIYALHDPDEVVMTVDGQDVIWEDYYYVYRNQALQMENMFLQYQAYGMALGWESEADDEGHSYAELMGSGTEENLRRVMTVEAVAAEEGITLDNTAEEVQAEHQNNIKGFCGEDGTEEQLFDQLRTMHLRPELYWRMVKVNLLSHLVYEKSFGEEGEMLDDQQVLDWMEENGILSADHMLILTEELGEAEAAEKKELAEQLAAELQAIEDPEERIARFRELKEQYNEDPGATEGYVFGKGTMVDEFYDGTAALEVDQISAPVETQYGYHIILRRALHADDQIFTGYSSQSARSLASSGLFSQRMQAKLDAQKVEYAPGFEAPAILDYYTKPNYTA